MTLTVAVALCAPQPRRPKHLQTRTPSAVVAPFQTYVGCACLWLGAFMSDSSLLGFSRWCAVREVQRVPPATWRLAYWLEVCSRRGTQASHSLRGDSRRDTHFLNQLLRSRELTELTLLVEHFAQDFVGGERVGEHHSEYDSGASLTDFWRQGGA